MLNLVVGDVHCTPDELEDCEALLVAVRQYAADCELVTFLGDQFHTHDVVNVRCIDFWHEHLKVLACGGRKVVLMRGNHDQVTPTQGYPHSLIPFAAMPGVFVADGLNEPIPVEGVGFLPYYYNQSDFLKAYSETAKRCHTIFCHQTFQGAYYENAFYAKDGIALALMAERTVISGHIHSPQQVGYVQYVGAPRWRTRSDANQERFINLFGHSATGSEIVKSISTAEYCKKIHQFDDTPENPLTRTRLDSVVRPHHKVLVDVYGPTRGWVRDREQECKGWSSSMVTRGFPTRERSPEVSESEGIEKSFAKFEAKFLPPNGTDKAVISQMVRDRMSKHE